MSATTKTTITPTPFGLFAVEENQAQELTKCILYSLDKLPEISREKNDSLSYLEIKEQELSPYLEELKKRPLAIQGTPFQKSVWSALLNIPFGSTVSYGDIAEEIGKPKAVRAVGTAIGKNEHCVLIPCHRVTQKNGTLGGFRWGTNRKKELLAWERSLLL